MKPSVIYGTVVISFVAGLGFCSLLHSPHTPPAAKPALAAKTNSNPKSTESRVSLWAMHRAFRALAPYLVWEDDRVEFAYKSPDNLFEAVRALQPISNGEKRFIIYYRPITQTKRPFVSGSGGDIYLTHPLEEVPDMSWAPFPPAPPPAPGGDDDHLRLDYRQEGFWRKESP